MDDHSPIRPPTEVALSLFKGALRRVCADALAPFPADSAHAHSVSSRLAGAAALGGASLPAEQSPASTLEFSSAAPPTELALARLLSSLVSLASSQATSAEDVKSSLLRVATQHLTSGTSQRPSAPLAPSEDSELRALLESVRARTLQEASRRVGTAAAPGLHAGLGDLLEIAVADCAHPTALLTALSTALRVRKEAGQKGACRVPLGPLARARLKGLLAEVMHAAPLAWAPAPAASPAAPPTYLDLSSLAASGNGPEPAAATIRVHGLAAGRDALHVSVGVYDSATGTGAPRCVDLMLATFPKPSAATAGPSGRGAALAPLSAFSVAHLFPQRVLPRTAGSPAGGGEGGVWRHPLLSAMPTGGALDPVVLLLQATNGCGGACEEEEEVVEEEGGGWGGGWRAPF